MNFSPLFIILIGNLFYVFSEVLLKLFPINATLLDISLVRFGVGLTLIPFASRALVGQLPVIGFAITNTINSIAGYGAIIYGSYQGFSIASQLRPVFVGIISVFVLKEKSTISDLLVIFGCFAISILMNQYDSSIFQPWTIIFIATVFFQSLSFSLIGNTKNHIGTLGYVSVYNLLGFFVVLLIQILYKFTIVKISFYDFTVLFASGIFGLMGSVLVVSAFQATQKAKTVAGMYIRFPLSLLIAYFLLNETVKFSTMVGCIIMVFLIGVVGFRKQ